MLYMIDSFALSSIRSFGNKELDHNENKLATLSSFAYRYTRNRINKTKTTKKQREKIISYLANNVDIEIEFLKEKCEGKSSPQILLVLALDRLVNVIQDKNAKLMFKPFDMGSYIDLIFGYKGFREPLKEHNVFLDKVLNNKIGEKKKVA